MWQGVEGGEAEGEWGRGFEGVGGVVDGEQEGGRWSGPLGGEGERGAGEVGGR